MTVLQDRILDLVRHFGSYQKAAMKLECDHAYLHKLAKGTKDDPSPELLKRIGVRRIVTVTYQDCP